MTRKRSNQVVPAEHGPVSRRTLLSWLGNATVLALAPESLSACGDTEAAPGASAADNAGATEARGTSAGFAFQPAAADGGLFDGWRSNTVDSQDLAEILESWSLMVDGLVERPATLSFAELTGLPRQDQVTDFHCVEGWSVYDVPWNGVHIDSLMDLVRPRAAATHVTFHCVGDVYSESLPLEVAREPRTLLAYGIGGNTLPQTHGFPLRLVVPRLFGYKSAKWVKRVEFTDFAEQGFWVQRGYSYLADVPEARLRDGKY